MKLTGTNRTTGRAITGPDHVRQCIHDILTTPIGTRIAQREYGSRLFELIDNPQNPTLRIDLIAATAAAVDRWEPRVKLELVTVAFNSNGRPVLDLAGRYLPDGEQIKINGLVL